MTKYSRTAKYEDLRNKLAQDSEPEIKTNDLSQFANRLNKINSDNFEPMEMSNADSHDPIHARREEYLRGENPAVSKQTTNEVTFTQTVPVVKTPLVNDYAKKNSSDLTTFDNEYLDEYINEVKQYNVEHGNSITEDTQSNILREIRGEKPAPKKPFESKIDVSGETADIPFINSVNNTSAINMTPVEEELEQTRENIAKEVQNLVNDTATNSFSFEDGDVELPKIAGMVSASEVSPAIENQLKQQLESEKTARQQLLTQTNQMRVQLDEYEDDLNDVSDKMQHTNRILNFVLIVLIVALVIVLGIVVYWILLSKGII